MFEPIQTEVINQLKRREAIFGKTERQVNDIHFLNNRTGWVRLISSINTDAAYNIELTGDIKLASSNSEPAKNFILSSAVNYDKKRSGISFDASSPSSLYNYSVAFGVRPSPGITDFKIVSKNRFGTIREATVNFNVWSIEDLNIIEKLYFHPGFTGIVEWGHTIIVDNGGNVQTDPAFNTNLDLLFEKQTFSEIEEIIAENKRRHSYNYDAFIGYFKNFNWSFRPDGGYDCSVSLISLGEVMDSLSVKLPPTKVSVTKTTKQPREHKTLIHQFIHDIQEGNDSNSLYLEKNISDLSNDLRSALLHSSDETGFTQDTLICRGLKVTLVHNPYWWNQYGFLSYISLRTLLILLNTRYSLNYGNQDCNTNNTSLQFETTPNPGKAPKFNTFPEHFSLDPGVCLLPNPPNLTKIIPEGFTFGGKIIAPQELSNRIGLSEVVSRLKTSVFSLDNTEYEECLNIMVCLDTILESAEKFTNKIGPNFEITVLDFVKDILGKINEALGNITELDLATYDETGRIFSIVDRKLTPDFSKDENNDPYQLTLTGLRSQVSQLSIQSKISNKLGSMISIAAQGTDPTGTLKQGNYNEDISLWTEYNKGLIDRHIQDLTVGIPSKCIDKDITESAETTSELTWYQNLLIDLSLFLVNPTSIFAPASVNTDILKNENEEILKFLKCVNVAWNNGIFRKYNREYFENLKVTGQKIFKQLNLTEYVNKETGESIPKGVIPVELSFTLDGISGLKIGNAFTISSDVVPEKFNGYGYIIVGLDHSINNSKWVTNVRAQTFLLNGKSPSTPQTTSSPGTSRSAVPLPSNGTTNFQADKTLSNYNQAKKKAETYLGRSINDDNWNSLIAATSAEAGNQNKEELAWVMAVILNRVRPNPAFTVKSILSEPKEFQAVTGTSERPGPSSGFLKGPSGFREESIYSSIIDNLQQDKIPITYLFFTSDLVGAYKGGTNINVKYCMACQPDALVKGQSIFSKTFPPKSCVNQVPKLTKKPCKDSSVSTTI
jgi:hypothetical protein